MGNNKPSRSVYMYFPRQPTKLARKGADNDCNDPFRSATICLLMHDAAAPYITQATIDRRLDPNNAYMALIDPIYHWSI